MCSNAAPFQFTPNYQPAPGIKRYICGTPAILAIDRVLNNTQLTVDTDLLIKKIRVALTQTGKIAITNTGCLGPCGFGASVLVYPEGVLYGKKRLLNAMPPYQGGGDMIERVTFDKTTYKDAPGRFEAGTPAIVEAIGLAAAVDYVEAIGIEAIHAHEERLVTLCRDELRRLNSVTLFGPEQSAGIVSFAMEGVHPHDLGTILDEEHVAIRAGQDRKSVV